MTKIRQILTLVIGGFLVGILLASFVDFGWSIIGLFLILALAFGGLFLKEKSRIFAVVAIICFGLVLGLARFSFVRDSAENKKIITSCSQSQKVMKEEPVGCRGLVITDPDRREKTTRLVIEEVVRDPISLREKRSLTTSKILVITDNFTDYFYGDQIEIIGKIERPQNFLTEPPSPNASARQSKVFDYQNYLKVRGIEYVAYYPKIKIFAHNQGSMIKAGLFDFKNNFLANLRQVLPEPSATLGGGLILGDKGGLGQKTENEFRRAGISHIIVLSGYNITVAAKGAMIIFSFILGAWSWLAGIVAIILFVLMAGGEAAAVRSAFMVGLVLLAQRFGHKFNAGVALLTAGFLMVLWNPRLLVFDLGFQLSFLATLGMVYISPLVAKLLSSANKFLRSRFSRSEMGLRGNLEHESQLLRKTTSGSLEVAFLKSWPGALKELVATTTGAQLAVYPWLLLQTGNATLIGFISNIFILPAVPLAMLGSFITGLLGFISYYLSLLISYPTYFLLAYILKLAHWFSLL